MIVKSGQQKLLKVVVGIWPTKIARKIVHGS